MGIPVVEEYLCLFVRDDSLFGHDQDGNREKPLRPFHDAALRHACKTDCREVNQLKPMLCEESGNSVRTTCVSAAGLQAPESLRGML